MVTMKFYYLNRSLETRTGVTWNYTMLETALESSTVPGARMGFGTRKAVSLGGVSGYHNSERVLQWVSPFMKD